MAIFRMFPVFFVGVAQELRNLVRQPRFQGVSSSRPLSIQVTLYTSPKGWSLENSEPKTH